MKFKFTWKIWLLIILIVLSIISIINFQALSAQGVIVKSLESNSTEYQNGLRQGDVITSVNGKEVSNSVEYVKVMSDIFSNNNELTKLVIDTETSQVVFFSDKMPKISVSNIQKTKLKAGLDLQGGARALVKPEKDIDARQMQDLIAISSQRLNTFGITDIVIRPVSDLSGTSYMLIEIAGATPQDLENLIAEQGKFEAKIGNETAFVGGNNDITHVCRDDASCSGIEACNPTGTGYFCNYAFTIYLSEEAAQRHADITKVLSTNISNPDYLDKMLDFYIDDKQTQSLLIHKNLKGQVTTQVQISGSGQGATREEAIKNAESEMKTTQTILITGSLPYKLEIVKLDTISPILGQKFTYLILLTGLVGLLAVSVIIFFRYRNIKASLAILFTSFSEVIILLGVAALIKWNLDLPSIVGILVMIGTGVDQQIIILDESKSSSTSMKEKLKGALFIVVSCFLTVVCSLLPLFWAGAGLLKGFAVTTLIGLTIGVLITRPAFADVIKLLHKE
jgi:preprotein translocase subunit SecD